MPIPKVYGVAFFTPTFQFNRSEFSVRSVGATRSVWARETAGASPAALTIFELLPWSNTSGIRLLSGTMQVELLPAAPLPGGVKVARRFVKPHGVGASPTLAANFQGVMSAADGLVRNEEVAGATPAALTLSGRQADISWLRLSRKQDRREPRSEHYRRLPPFSQ